MRRPIALLASAALFASAPLAADHHMGSEGGSEELTAALAMDNRAEDRARDQYRHPAETLAFFQVEPGMKVGEYAPGGGWYSRVLGNYLNEEGRLVGLYFTPDGGAFNEETQARIREGATGFPAQVEEWTGRPAAQTAGLTLDTITDEDKGTFDRVLVVRMMHNMMRWNIADSELKVMRDLLAPGGMLGIVQHRAPEDASAEYANGTKGYLRQDDVVGFVEAMGFELVDASEVNANPNDPANWEGGVWTMPPSLGGDDAMDAQTRDLGESDRMTLLFRKRD